MVVLHSASTVHGKCSRLSSVGLDREWQRRRQSSLVVASMEIGLEVNAEKTKHVVMSGDQNAGQNINRQTGNKSFVTVQQFKYLGTTLKNQNYIHEEMKSRLKSGNACYHSVQNCLSSTVLFKNVKIKV